MEFLSHRLQPLSSLSSAELYTHTLDRMCMGVELRIGRNDVGRNLKNRYSLIIKTFHKSSPYFQELKIVTYLFRGYKHKVRPDIPAGIVW
jgi:hypothetical protein